MLTARRHMALIAALIAATGLFCSTRATAVEDGLMDVRIGASYRELIKRLGQPTGILFSAGGSMMYQVTPQRAQAGLPVFGAQPPSTETPAWVVPAMPGSLGEQEGEWLYDLRRSKGVALGAVLSGKGADAVVTDVIVAGYPEYLKGKPVPLRTEKGIALQSTFSEILKKYGYPPMIEIYAPSGGGAAGAGRVATAAAGGARGGRGGAGAGGGMRAGGGRGRGGGGMRGGARGGRMRGDLGITTRAIASAPPFSVVLTGGMGGRRGGRGGGGGMGGRRGGRGGGGGMGGRRGGGGGMGGRRGGGAGRGGGVARGGAGGARAGRGALPPLTTGALAAGAAGQLTATAMVNNQAISFSRDCILTYEGIAFTLHDLKVIRIHVSE